ncbi:MAG: GNAT family N-acetyltransferase [Myxococcales bacterium]|nr:GNAT family N-acetyltransferase [Myxococcales bacterium]MCB9539441.1 GNAT family N-acetyltransferase [Myxococcales bacterium]
MSVAPLVLRDATVADAEGIARAQVAAWHATYRGLMPDATLDAFTVEGRTERWRANLSAPDGDVVTRVAQRDGRVLGFASAGANRIADLDVDGELWALYVDPAHRGEGAGWALFADAARVLRAAGRTSMGLTVLRDNTVGRAFYDRQGGVIAAPGRCAVGADDLPAVLYVWRDLAALTSPAPPSSSGT